MILQALRNKNNILKSYFNNVFAGKGIHYIAENEDWVIKKEGEYIVSNLRKIGIKACVTFNNKFIRNSLVHYGSLNVFAPSLDEVSLPLKGNKVVVTCFHLVPGDPRVSCLSKLDNLVDLWHTASSSTKTEMVKVGIPEAKISVVCLGVDLKIFRTLRDDERLALRRRYEIPDKAIVIGSFQKDGQGWGEGNRPKMIKGPDIFCEAVERLAKDYSVYVLLTGPSRGFVKNLLDSREIPYRHMYVRYRDLPKFYNMLDLYLITSRVEGLPKSILECMATSTPLVTTRVGIATDVITDKVSGFICEVGDVAGIVARARTLIEDKAVRDSMRRSMQDAVLDYEWNKVIRRYRDSVYAGLIQC